MWPREVSKTPRTLSPQQIGPQGLLIRLSLRLLLFTHGQLFFQRQPALVQKRHHQVFLKGEQGALPPDGDPHHGQRAAGSPDGEVETFGTRQGVGGGAGVLVVFHDPFRHRLLIGRQQSGALGQVREVWSWSDRFNAQRSLSPVIEPPKGMNWDLWVGPAEMRPYRRSYLGQRWYDIRGFGNGSLGNMGNHVLDAPFWALNLMNTPPTSVTMEDMSYVCPESWPM